MSLLLRSTIRMALGQRTQKLSLLGVEVAEQINGSRSIARWYAPTLKELVRRKKIFAEKLPQIERRSTFIDWNLSAELYSFGRRLNENFDQTLLQTAFTQRSYIVQEELRQQSVGIEEPVLNITDNRALAAKGEEITKKYVYAYLRHHLPKYPGDGINAVANYLLSTEKLAYISTFLGTKEIILSEEYPPSDESRATTFLAVIGALSESNANGENDAMERAYNFVRDFVCTQLNQVDVNELWRIDQPFELLKTVCAQRNMNQIVPRIIGQVGQGDILASCRIGIYDSESKKLLGIGFGETYDNGVETASFDALSKMFGSYNLRPFSYDISAAELFKEGNASRGKLMAN